MAKLKLKSTTTPTREQYNNAVEKLIWYKNEGISSAQTADSKKEIAQLQGIVNAYEAANKNAIAEREKKERDAIEERKRKEQEAEYNKMLAERAVKNPAPQQEIGADGKVRDKKVYGKIFTENSPTLNGAADIRKEYESMSRTELKALKESLEKKAFGVTPEDALRLDIINKILEVDFKEEYLTEKPKEESREDKKAAEAAYKAKSDERAAYMEKYNKWYNFYISKGQSDADAKRNAIHSADNYSDSDYSAMQTTRFTLDGDAGQIATKDLTHDLNNITEKLEKYNKTNLYDWLTETYNDLQSMRGTASQMLNSLAQRYTAAYIDKDVTGKYSLVVKDSSFGNKNIAKNISVRQLGGYEKGSNDANMVNYLFKYVDLLNSYETAAYNATSLYGKQTGTGAERLQKLAETEYYSGDSGIYLDKNSATQWKHDDSKRIQGTRSNAALTRDHTETIDDYSTATNADTEKRDVKTRQEQALYITLLRYLDDYDNTPESKPQKIDSIVDNINSIVDYYINTTDDYNRALLCANIARDVLSTTTDPALAEYKSRKNDIVAFYTNLANKIAERDRAGQRGAAEVARDIISGKEGEPK